MRSSDVNSSTHIEFSVANNDKSPKFQVDDHVRISNHLYSCKKFYSKLVGRSFSNQKS